MRCRNLLVGEPFAELAIVKLPLSSTGTNDIDGDIALLKRRPERGNLKAAASCKQCEAGGNDEPRQPH